MEHFDFIVVGAGSGGLTAADFAFQIGKNVLIVEKENFGGDCTHYGCVPSKSIIHIAELVSKGQNLTMRQVHEYVQGKVERVYVEESAQAFAEKYNALSSSGKRGRMKVITGEAHLLPRNRVKVGDSVFRAEVICIATGAEPKTAPLDKVFDQIQSRKNIWSYKDVWNVDEKLPKTLAVFGGGPIGCELAQAFSRLGSKVTIYANELLPREAPSMRDVITKQFEKEGIRIIQERPAKVLEVDGTGLLKVIAGSSEMETDAVLYSIGRDPILPQGAASLLQVSPTDGGLIVDKNLKCKAKSGQIIGKIYACGDCISGNLQFTHYAGKQGYITARNAFLAFTSPGMVPEEIPRVTFTSPELGSIGYNTVENAKQKGFSDACSISLSGAHVDRAITDDEETTTEYELILDSSKGTDPVILGGNIAGKNAGEVLGMLCIAVKTKMKLSEFADVVLPYPTYGFGLLSLASKETTLRFSSSSKAYIAKKLNFK